MGLVMRPRRGLLRMAVGSAVAGSQRGRRARAEQEQINDRAQAGYEATRGAAAPLVRPCGSGDVRAAAPPGP